MINYSEIKKHDNLEWGSYLSLPGHSYSFLKSERYGLNKPVQETDKMRIGTLVDAIITGGKIDMASPLYPAARDIASKIVGMFGSMITRFEKQVSYSATMEYQGFKIQTRGRLDFLLPGIAVVDLKVTQAKDVRPIIRHFGYDNQLWHYGKMAGVKKGYLMVHSVPLKKTEIIVIDISSNTNEFFAEKIIKFGTYGEA